jgi:rhodanese-related sulfurtransferase
MNDHSTDIALQPIAIDEVIAHVANGDVFLLDLRGGSHHKQIYGAIRYDRRKLLDAPKLTLPLPKADGLIVLYDEDGTSGELVRVGERLRESGYAEVRALAGGFHAYEAAGGKLEDTTMEQPVPLVSEHQLDR